MAVAAKSTLEVGINLTGTVGQWNAITAAGVVASAAGRAVGFAQFAGVSGDRCTTTVLGTAIAIAGGAIAIGAQVEVGSAGKVVTKSAGVPIGVALTATAADGDQLEVLLIPN